MTPEHTHWMNYALALAEKALPQDVPVGAVLVNEAGDVLGEGWNTREADHDPTAHAEMMALREAGRQKGDWRLTGCTLYVTLEPCPMCAAALLQARVSTVVFGADDPIQGALGGALNLGPLYGNPMAIKGGIEAEACRAQLDTFFQSLRAQ